MNLSKIPFKPQIGKLLNTIIPNDMTVPILQGRIKGKKWIVKSSNIECALGCYENEKKTLFEQRVRKSSVIYDIGAHVGFYSLLAAELVGSNGKVFSFEPVPRNIKYLKKHIELNHYNNVIIVEAAVSNESGVCHFEESTSSFMGHLSDGGSLTVQIVSIDEFVKKKTIPPDLIKIDAEGAELLILDGAKSTLINYSPEIFLATHSPKLRADCLELLASIGYEIESIGGTESYLSNEVIAHRKRGEDSIDN